MSRFVIAFLPRGKCLLISRLWSPSTMILEPRKIKSVTVSTFIPIYFIPIYLPWSDETRCYDLSFLNVEFSASFFTLLFHPHQELFSSSHAAIRVVLSAYLRLLTFLPAILIPVCESSSLAFYMMYSEKVKTGWQYTACHTPFPILNQSIVPCPLLTVTSWPTYRFLKRQVRYSGIPTPLRIIQFVVIHTVKGFSIVNEAEVDAFLEFPCFFYDPTDVFP